MTSLLIFILLLDTQWENCGSSSVLFVDQHLSTTTFGIDFVAKNVIVQGQKYKAIIWDTSQINVFIFFHTFEYVRKVLKEVEKLCSSNVPVLLDEGVAFLSASDFS